jgi:Fe-only nitrogenase accessory protein AnfO
MNNIMRIAAFVNRDGEVGDFFEDGMICLFEKFTDSWQKIERIPLLLKEEMGLGEVKVALSTSLSEVKGCDVFLLRDLRGGIKAMLEDHGFRVWKSSGSLNEQLESVALREQEFVVVEDDPPPAPLPVGDVREACYRVNLIELLESGAPHVSRDVLMPFFELVSFKRLEIVCQHTPKWFAVELSSLGLHMESVTPASAGNGQLVVVVPTCGSRSCPPGRRAGGSGCHCG